MKYKWKGLLRFMSGCDIGYKSTFAGKNFIAYDTSFVGIMGYASYIGCECCISAEIGKYCCIASCVRTVNGFHPTKKFVSMHPAFYNKNNSINLNYNDVPHLVEEHRYGSPQFNLDVKIGNDVWVGARCTILAGVEIGDGAVIASGAVVVNNVPPYCIVAGVPAKVIKQRFDDEVIKKLLDVKWWNKSELWIKENASLFENIDDFINYIK